MNIKQGLAREDNIHYASLDDGEVCSHFSIIHLPWPSRKNVCVAVCAHEPGPLAVSSLSIHDKSMEINNLNRFNQKAMMFLGGYAYEYVKRFQKRN